jgi:tRNA(Ile2) C34 agmatinyltransferase TiaS
MNEGAEGAFVMAWLWVSDEEAGLSRCAECGEAYSTGGDGYDGRCPDCADARENEGGA